MPYTRVGAGLDMEYSVAGFKQIHSALHKVTVEVEDPRLIGATSTRFSTRMLAGVSRLLCFLPDAMWKLLFEPKPEPLLGATSKAFDSPTRALGDSSLAPVESRNDSYREMASTRRYGNE
jgi:hypothetical protein